ncbi:MAG: hypothetical protein ACTSRP_09090 [Candidatus Helarchaeota archaeon]
MIVIRIDKKILEKIREILKVENNNIEENIYDIIRNFLKKYKN